MIISKKFPLQKKITLHSTEQNDLLDEFKKNDMV